MIVNSFKMKHYKIYYTLSKIVWKNLKVKLKKNYKN